MLAQPSSGCYFLLAVIFFSGIKAQGYDDPGNQTHVHHEDGNHEDVHHEDVHHEDGSTAHEHGNTGNETTVDAEYYYGDYDGYVDEAEGPVPPLPACSAEVCVRKRCPVGEVFLIDTINYDNGCRPKYENETAFEPQFSHKDGRPQDVQISKVEFLIGFPGELRQPDCPAVNLVGSDETPLLLQDGSLYIPEQEDTKRRSIHQYCIDRHRFIDEEGEWIELHVHACVLEFWTTRAIYRFYAHNTGFFISSVALMLLVLLHLVSPKMRDLAGCLIFSYAASVFVGNLGLLLFRLNPFTANCRVGKVTADCRAFAFIAHTGFLASYFWQVVMCFDIWRYVRSTVKGIPRSHMENRDMKTYLMYSVVVWGLLLLIEAFIITIEMLPASSLPENFIKPHLTNQHEFLSLFLYWSMFLCISLLLDLFFILTTAYHLKRSGANIFMCCSKSRVFAAESAVFNAKYLDLFWQRFTIFSMTVIIRIFELIPSKIPPAWMWEPTDLLITLEGAFIVVIFLGQKSKRNEISSIFRKWVEAVKKSEKMMDERKSSSAASSIPSQITTITDVAWRALAREGCGDEFRYENEGIGNPSHPVIEKL